MNYELFEGIKEFVIKFSCIRNVELTRNTNIEKEVGLTGDDAIEFIIAFGEKFEVDVSNFMAANYFDAEGDNFFPVIGRLAGRENAQKKELLLGDLEQAVIAGKLDDTTIDSAKATN